jgi:O-acetyl-ADP-ribose deacetylase (regulator of RNase III)
LEECRRHGGCATGDAKLTTGGLLPAKYVIHTVGPVYRDGLHGEPELLASCHRRSLEVAVEHGIKTVSFPAISCGVYGYPIRDAARIALRTAADFLREHSGIDRVRFVLFAHDTFEEFAAALREMMPER